MSAMNMPYNSISTIHLFTVFLPITDSLVAFPLFNTPFMRGTFRYKEILLSITVTCFANQCEITPIAKVCILYVSDSAKATVCVLTQLHMHTR
jgi:hypothetical protein